MTPVFFTETFLQLSKNHRLHGALLAGHCHLGGLNLQANLRKRYPNGILVGISHSRTSRIESSCFRLSLLLMFLGRGGAVKTFLQEQKW